MLPPDQKKRWGGGFSDNKTPGGEGTVGKRDAKQTGANAGVLRFSNGYVPRPNRGTRPQTGGNKGAC